MATDEERKELYNIIVFMVCQIKAEDWNDVAAHIALLSKDDLTDYFMTAMIVLSSMVEQHEFPPNNPPKQLD